MAQAPLSKLPSDVNAQSAGSQGSLEKTNIVAGSCRDEFSYGAVDRPRRCSREGSGLLGVDNLPDLSERLRKAGIYGEYQLYRTRYIQWRRGGPQGASGELRASSLKDMTGDPYKFEYWYPSASIFKWRFTACFWKAILYLVGSMMFTYSSSIAYFGAPGGQLMTSWPNMVGAVMFFVAGYFGYLQMINMSVDTEEKVCYFWPDDFWELERRVSASSIVGILAFLIGAGIFGVAVFVCEAQGLSNVANITFVGLPNVLGSVCFVAGGFAEVVHNGLFRRGGASIGEPVWWCSMGNFVGGVCFLLASAPGLLGTDNSEGMASFIDLNFLVGSALFVLSSTLMVVMWRANDFGLALLSQLNTAIKAGGQVSVTTRTGGPTGQYMGVYVEAPPETAEDVAAEDHRRFDLRGIFFIVVYCWALFVAIVNCATQQLWFQVSIETSLMRHFLNVGIQVFIVLVVVLVLVVHSVVTRIPEEQPWQCLLLTTRVTVLAITTIQTMMLCEFLVFSTPVDQLHPAAPRTYNSVIGSGVPVAAIQAHTSLPPVGSPRLPFSIWSALMSLR